MKHFIISYFLLTASFSIFAHPGIGIVKDSKGNIYYTDLSQVWKITPAGLKTGVVNNVHTHELYMDAADDLYGEHLWYSGGQANTWGHYAWCLRHNGKLDTVIKPTAAFLTDYSFVRDGEGNMYWVQRFTVSKFKKRTTDGHVSTIAEGKFKNIRWMHATRKGTIYFIDLTDLYKIENGKFTLLAGNLQERTSVFEYASLDHNVYGIWNDKAENIYVAVFGGQVVKKITPEGKISNVVYSSGTWRPNSGLFDDAGNLWLMETNALNETRVKKITQEDLARSLSPLPHLVRKAMPFVLVAALFIFLALFLFKLKRKIFIPKVKPVLV